MAVMTTSPKKIDTNEQQSDTKKKPFNKIRPITATLDHPLILDIKLLKKLDMTTFTKKGLIALSKFCGISLIRKSDSKRKFNKSIKSIQYSKRQSSGEVKGQCSDSVKKNHIKPKRKPLKQIPKIKPRVNFKLDDSNCYEDSDGVVCKRHDKIIKNNQKLTKPSELNRTKEGNSINKKDIIDDIFNSTIDNLIPEPCKSCNRSEYPERFHSHPKASSKDSESTRNHKLEVKSTDGVSLEEKFKSSVTTKDCDNTERKRTNGSNGGSQNLRDKNRKDATIESPQKSLSSFEEHNMSLPLRLSPEIRRNSVSPSSSTSSNDHLKLSEVKNNKKSKNIKKPSQSTTKSSDKKTEEKNDALHHKETDQTHAASPVEDTMKYVTGCYICGKQVPSKLRIKHEENCIIEWRTQNNLLSPEKRKPEPRRPDFRFTAAGDVDCEGTFESIWANHKDSLVPCKKCGRTFFPNRIERHETCCNNLPLRVKYKH